MIRIPLGPALPVLALGLAAVFVSPSLFGGVDGEPIRVAATPHPALQLANFEGEACARAARAPAADAAGVRVVAVTLDSDGDRTIVDLDEVTAGSVAPDATLVLLLDSEGRLIAAGDAGALSGETARAAFATGCEAEAVHGAI